MSTKPLTFCRGGCRFRAITATYLVSLFTLPKAVAAITAGIFGAFDFFEAYGFDELDPSLRHFNLTARTYVDDFQIVATNDRIVRIDPESWNPFATNIEVLAFESPTTLRIVQCHEFLALHEKVKLVFDEHGEATELDYAGWKADVV